MNEDKNPEQTLDTIVRRLLHENIRAAATSQLRFNRTSPIGSNKDLLAPEVSRYLKFISMMSVAK